MKFDFVENTLSPKPERNRKNNMQNTPKIGQYLYATCADEDYGKILAVGKDENGVDCIDIEVFDPNNLLSFNDNKENPTNPLTRLEISEGAKIILRDLQYKNSNAVWAYIIECNTPGNNCYRCTKSFIVEDRDSK